MFDTDAIHTAHAAVYNGGHHTFPNGYTCSVGTGVHAYGGREVAVLYNEQLDYSTHITDDVVPHVSSYDLFILLTAISLLPAKGVS